MGMRSPGGRGLPDRTGWLGGKVVRGDAGRWSEYLETCLRTASRQGRKGLHPDSRVFLVGGPLRLDDSTDPTKNPPRIAPGG